MQQKTMKEFQTIILKWYQKNKRSMPWRNTRDPYKILVSEIMLHQTQVSRVLPKYKEFLAAFPNIKILANADNKKLLKTWRGLGYWHRATNLKEAAKQITEHHKGIFPKDAKTLETLPGVGPYTAHALACFAWNAEEPFIDTNIRRVYIHFFFSKKKSVSDPEILKVAKKALWKKNPREWHYALFDYGAIALKDKSINKKSRHYAKQSPFKGSFRSFRTRALRHILEKRGKRVSQETLENFLETLMRQEETKYAAKDILASLEKDGLVKNKKGFYEI